MEGLTGQGCRCNDCKEKVVQLLWDWMYYNSCWFMDISQQNQAQTSSLDFTWLPSPLFFNLHIFYTKHFSLVQCVLILSFDVSDFWCFIICYAVLSFARIEKVREREREEVCGVTAKLWRMARDILWGSLSSPNVKLHSWLTCHVT